MAKLMLVDGNSLTYRAFFALPTDITLASGQVTNAAYGFTSMLLNLVRDHQPDGIGVAFDRPEPTFRHEAVADYKAGRSAAPDILRQQMGLVRQVVETLRIPTIEAPGFEADDIIATLATEARDQGDEVLIVTGDRDVYQLVEDPLIKVLYNRRGVSDYALYDEAGIEERCGVPPKMYTEYASLRGDTSDNLPGVPGVGEKTAAKLITKYGGIDGIYEHLDEQTPKLRSNLSEHEAQVRSNSEVMVLLRDVPLDDVGVRDALRALIGDGGRPIAAHGAKPSMRALLGQLEADLRTLRLDTMLAAYLLDPAESRYLLGDLLLRYAHLELPVGAGATSGELQFDLDGDVVPASVDAARRALAVDRLVAPISAALAAQGLSALHDDIEVPLVRVLARMEDIGIGRE